MIEKERKLELTKEKSKLEEEEEQIKKQIEELQRRLKKVQEKLVEVKKEIGNSEEILRKEKKTYQEHVHKLLEIEKDLQENNSKISVSDDEIFLFSFFIEEFSFENSRKKKIFSHHDLDNMRDFILKQFNLFLDHIEKLISTFDNQNKTEIFEEISIKISPGKKKKKV